MPCRKSEFVSAINSFATARASGDINLQEYAASLVQQCVDSLEFEPEETEEVQGIPTED